MVWQPHEGGDDEKQSKFVGPVEWAFRKLELHSIVVCTLETAWLAWIVSF